MLDASDIHFFFALSHFVGLSFTWCSAKKLRFCKFQRHQATRMCAVSDSDSWMKRHEFRFRAFCCSSGNYSILCRATKRGGRPCFPMRLREHCETRSRHLLQQSGVDTQGITRTWKALRRKCGSDPRRWKSTQGFLGWTVPDSAGCFCEVPVLQNFLPSHSDLHKVWVYLPLCILQFITRTGGNMRLPWNPQDAFACLRTPNCTGFVTIRDPICHNE